MTAGKTRNSRTFFMQHIFLGVHTASVLPPGGKEEVLDLVDLLRLQKNPQRSGLQRGAKNACAFGHDTGMGVFALSHKKRSNALCALMERPKVQTLQSGHSSPKSIHLLTPLDPTRESRSKLPIPS